MQKVPYTNNGENTVHIGSATIQSGETRDVDPSLLPGYQPEGAVVEETKLDPIAELLKGSVKNISVELANLSDADLAHAGSLEQDGQNRKSLIEAMTAENLRRANDKAGA